MAPQEDAANGEPGQLRTPRRQDRPVTAGRQPRCMPNELHAIDARINQSRRDDRELGQRPSHLATQRAREHARIEWNGSILARCQQHHAITEDYQMKLAIGQVHRLYRIPFFPEFSSLALLIAGLSTGFFGITDDELLGVVSSALTAIFTLLVGHTISTRDKLTDASRLSDRLSDAIKNYLHVTRAGSAPQALEYITSRLPSLSEVRGTMLNFGDESETANDKLYDSQQYANFEAAIPPATARGLLWRDIGDPETVKRLRRILNAAEEEAGARRSHKYRYRIIKTKLPQMNFSILTFVNGDVELLFNWDYRALGRDPIVLLSRDEVIVDMFSQHFELLWRKASSDHDISATRSTSHM